MDQTQTKITNKTKTPRKERKSDVVQTLLPQPLASGEPKKRPAPDLEECNTFPIDLDNVSLKPKKKCCPSRNFMGYLMTIAEPQKTITGKTYRTLKVKVNYGFGVRTVRVTAFPNHEAADLEPGTQVKIEVVEQGKYFNLRSIEAAEFTDCFRCEYPIQGIQHGQVRSIKIHCFANKHL